MKEPCRHVGFMGLHYIVMLDFSNGFFSFTLQAKGVHSVPPQNA